MKIESIIRLYDYYKLAYNDNNFMEWLIEHHELGYEHEDYFFLLHDKIHSEMVEFQKGWV